MADLAAIIAEGEALAAKGHASFFSHDAGAARALDLLPHLLAVAKTAVEAERLTAIFQRDYITAPPDADSTAWTQRAWAASGEADEAIERLFAAVRGDAATGEGR